MLGNADGTVHDPYRPHLIMIEALQDAEPKEEIN